MLPKVRHVHVLGITSGDIGRRHAWENYYTPLRRGRLTYWSVCVDVSWARRLGLAAAFRDFPSVDALVATFCAGQRRGHGATYLSIDKDVFAPEVARTNWDQGRMFPQHDEAII